MNNTKRSYETNARARKWLIKEGFKEIHFFPHTRFSKDAHFQGLGWDGLATLGTKLALFQVKTNRGCSRKTRARMKDASHDSGVILMWINANLKKKQLEITLTSDNRDEVIKYQTGGKIR